MQHKREFRGGVKSVRNEFSIELKQEWLEQILGSLRIWVHPATREEERKLIGTLQRIGSIRKVRTWIGSPNILAR
ncbi:MAG: hypothetical protein NWE97_00275, partial [Candidatus Bathyarchaeota archaeon]|nr:hypothetical protein [Candidatus Bathyarchaeota archaeon]